MIVKSAMLIIMAFASANIMSKIKVPDSYSVEWESQTIKINLPEPFNEINIIITKSGKKLDSIVIETSRNKIRFEEKLLEGIEDIGNPEISFGRSDFDKDKKIDSFNIYFEYGKPKFVNLGNDVPGCESPCVESMRGIVVFTVNTDYEVFREYKGFDLD